jgi:acetyl-CoA synthetase
VTPKFWDKVASENFTWYQEWDKVVDFNMAETDIKWFTNAKVKKNCIDRHLAKEIKTIILNQMIQMEIAYFV